MIFLRIVVGAQVAAVRVLARREDRGQATAEYALVILGAAAIALLVLGWATKTNKISTLLNKVVDSITSKVT